jgi:hypothetical protein
MLIRIDINTSCGMAQAGNRQPLTPEARFRAQTSQYSNCGRQSGIWTSFLRLRRFPLLVSFHQRSILIHSSVTDIMYNLSTDSVLK